ncbi:MAG: hypothetical protein GWN85_30915 [Gemmatimonadetes bacterium]|nr:hypothetical protein [Gemmatimonadota bacterium]NIR39737.1 hypothetical protein [Actinomycetota bacterium]NIS34494.1 hypothetical protein [Actinomycetota bacterium]NIT97530.1 hypothetical protein [Actinomycetota bacterium]NIU69258.1 hypothetical protein [Actinomycetota bacterium]
MSPPPGGGVAKAVETIGSGRALVFAGGRVVEGTWSRPTPSDPITLDDADGDPIAVPPGRPWITYVPRNGEIDW